MRKFSPRRPGRTAFKRTSVTRTVKWAFFEFPSVTFGTFVTLGKVGFRLVYAEVGTLVRLAKMRAKMFCYLFILDPSLQTPGEGLNRTNLWADPSDASSLYLYMEARIENGAFYFRVFCGTDVSHWWISK